MQDWDAADTRSFPEARTQGKLANTVGTAWKQRVLESHSNLNAFVRAQARVHLVSYFSIFDKSQQLNAEKGALKCCFGSDQSLGRPEVDFPNSDSLSKVSQVK